MRLEYQKLIGEMEVEITDLLQNRKELKSCRDARRREQLKRMIEVAETERSSRYYRARNDLIRISKGSEDAEEIKVFIKKADRSFKGRRIKIYKPISIGEYASGFVAMVDQVRGVIEFKNGELFNIAKDAEQAWTVIRTLVEAGGDGFEFLGQGWQGAFSRDGKGDSDKLLNYIHPRRRGRAGDGYYILMPMSKTPVPRYEG